MIAAIDPSSQLNQLGFGLKTLILKAEIALDFRIRTALFNIGVIPRKALTGRQGF